MDAKEAASSAGNAMRIGFKNFIGWVAGLAAVGAVAWVAAGPTASSGTSESGAGPLGSSNEPLPVRCLTLRAVDGYDVERSYVGRVRADRSSRVGFEIGGRLKRVEVEAGQRVESGQKLGTLATDELEATRERLRAQLRVAEAELERLRAGPRKARIRAAEAEVEAKAARARLKAQERDRLREAEQSNAASEFEALKAELAAKEAEANRRTAYERLEELRAGAHTEEIVAQEARVAEAKGRLRELRVQIERSTLRAPFPGVVQRVMLHEGTVVQPGQAVLEVVDLQRLEAVVGVAVEDAGVFKVGGSLTVTVGGSGYEATVSAVLPQLDEGTNTAEVRLRLPEGAFKEVRPGQVTELTTSRRVERGGLWVPNTALVRAEEGLWAVYLMEPGGASEGAKASGGSSDDQPMGRVRRCPVELVHSGAKRSLIRGPVAAGQRVVASGTHRVTPGQLVRIVPGDEDSGALSRTEPGARARE